MAADVPIPFSGSVPLSVPLSAPRRVLLTADTVGGVWTYALELIAGLAAHGVEVILATLGRELSPAQAADLRRLDNVCVYPSAYKLEWMPDPWADLDRAGAWLLDIAARHQPDVIHLNSYGQAALPFSAPVLVAAHSCVLTWWQAVHRTPAPPDWDRYAALVRSALTHAGQVIAPSHGLLTALRRQYGPLPHARVIANGRRADRFPSGRKRPLVLAAGRIWDPAKNIAVLTACAADLPYPVYVAGETDAAQPDGVTPLPNVTALGMLSSTDLAAWLAAAEIYALPALYEPFGLSVLEAALAGCALVLGDLPSLRENWNGAALFVDPHDPADLGRGIRCLIEHPAYRRGLVRASRERARQFTPEHMTTAYLHAYADLHRSLSCAS